MNTSGALTAVKTLLRKGRRKADTSMDPRAKKYYVLEDVFDVLLGTFGPELTTKIIIDSKNIHWSVLFAYHCRERLSKEMRELLAIYVTQSKDFSESWAFLRGVEGLSTGTREKLLDNVPNVSDKDRLRLLSEPAIWGYDPG